MRFPKTARLRESGDFARLKQEGRTFPGRFFVLSALFVPEAENTPARLGLITSRRVGGAVQRNRVRRLLREVFRAARANILPGWWLVFIARAPAAGASLVELQAEWERLARRARLLQPAPLPAPPAQPNQEPLP